MGQFEVWVDITKNRLYVRSKGFFMPNDSDTEEVREMKLAELEKLKPGFDHISDITELSVATPEGIRGIRDTFNMYVQKEIGRSILVMGESLARMQILRVAKEAGLKIEVAASVEEADRMLDKPR